MPKARTLGSAIVTVVVLWAAAANIAPNIFGVSTDRQTAITVLREWLWNPSLIWLALPIAVTWFAWLLHRLASNIDYEAQSVVNVGKKLNDLETRLLGQINQTGAAINQRVGTIEDHVVKIAEFVTGDEGLGRANVRLNLHEARLDKISKHLGPLDFGDRAAEIINTWRSPDGKSFTRDQVKALSEAERAVLFKRYPGAMDWYMEFK